MPRMPKKLKKELAFFLNDRERRSYNELCRKCQHECKQSFRAVIIDCPRYLSKLSDGELRETQTANYFSNLYPIDCAVPSVDA